MNYSDRYQAGLVLADFYAVGLWYNDFSQTTDDEVIKLLTLSN